MIIRDGRNVEHDLGPVMRRGWSVLALKPIGGRGLREGQDYKEFAKRLRFKPKLERTPTRVLLHVECAHCKTVFETYSARKAFCSKSCVDKRWRKLNPRPSRAKLRVVAETRCEHPDKPSIARGLCRACYMREWRAARKAA